MKKFQLRHVFTNELFLIAPIVKAAYSPYNNYAAYGAAYHAPIAGELTLAS